MLILTVPKNQKSFSFSKIYYVTSESNPDAEPHIVHRIKSAAANTFFYFCDCRDFMVRRLPKLALPPFEPCKHGKFVRDIDQSLPAGTEVVSAIRDNIKTVPAR